MEKRKRWTMRLVKPLPKSMPDQGPYWEDREPWKRGEFVLEKSDLNYGTWNRLKPGHQRLNKIRDYANGMIERMIAQ